uniref:Uncharacterized protein n=1 Tax=Anguilla anguilla TaxID=7936 RepID=A0A0E9VVM8_ANGAN
MLMGPEISRISTIMASDNGDKNTFKYKLNQHLFWKFKKARCQKICS